MNDIILKNITKRFGERVILDNFSYVFKGGETTVIKGMSGKGKTTLLNIIAGLDKDFEGTVDGINGKLGYVFQENRLCENFSVKSNIKAVVDKNFPEDEIMLHLKEVGLEALADKPVKILSGGEKRRCAIVRAVCYNADVILLDEAFKGLDTEKRLQTMNYVKKHCAGKTVICVSHEEIEADYMSSTEPLTL